MATIKLTGVLVGNEEKGFTSFFKEFPFITSEGKTEQEAELNLLEAVALSFETMSEIIEEEKEITPPSNNYREFRKELTIA